MSEAAQELIVIPQDTALQVFTTPGSIEPYLEQIKNAVTGIVPDLTTKKGRDAVASLAFKVTKSKTYIEGVGKGLADQQKEIPKKIDATRKTAREFLDALAAEVRQPLTEWEAEQARIEREAQERAAQIQASIDRLAVPEAFLLGSDAETLQGAIDSVSALVIDEERYGARIDEASMARTKALGDLQVALDRRKTYDAEQAELAELRRRQAEREQKDREEQIRREAEENARKQAEQQAQADRDAAAKREQELQAQADQAERDRLDAEERAAQAERDAQARADQAAEQERQRIADEQRQEQEASAAREADREHRKAVNTAALNAFIEGGLDAEAAKVAVTLIAQRRIPAVSIAY